MESENEDKNNNLSDYKNRYISLSRQITGLTPIPSQWHTDTWKALTIQKLNETQIYENNF